MASENVTQGDAADLLCSAGDDLVMEDKKPPSKTPLALDQLPVEIQRCIYANLLDSDRVRQPPDRYSIISYRFETAVLSVNKRVHQISRDVLYKGNTFIVVSCDWQVISTAMLLHGVAVVSSDRTVVARFRQHFLRLHIIVPPSFQPNQMTPSGSTVPASFILLQDDLDCFVRMLNIQTFMFQSGEASYDIGFWLEHTVSGSPDVHVQKLLLEPFRRLISGTYNIKMYGRVNTDYWQGLHHDITFKIYWTRGVAWRFYSLMVSIIEDAEETTRQRRFAVAYKKYDDPRYLFFITMRDNSKLEKLEDEGFHKSCSSLMALCETNKTLLGLKFPFTAGVKGGSTWALQHTNWLDMASDEASCSQFQLLARSKMRYYRAVVKLRAGNNTGALDELTEALRLDPNNARVGRFIATIRRWDAAETWAEKGVISQEGAAEMSPDMVTDLLRVPKPVYTPSRSIATERAILRDLGFKGDLLPQIPASTPVSSQQVELIIKGLRSTNKHKSVSLTAFDTPWGLGTSLT